MSSFQHFEQSQACELRGLVSLERFRNLWAILQSIIKLVSKCSSGHDVYFPKSVFYRKSTRWMLDTAHQSWPGNNRINFARICLTYITITCSSCCSPSALPGGFDPASPLAPLFVRVVNIPQPIAYDILYPSKPDSNIISGFDDIETKLSARLSILIIKKRIYLHTNKKNLAS